MEPPFEVAAGLPLAGPVAEGVGSSRLDASLAAAGGVTFSGSTRSTAQISSEYSHFTPLDAPPSVPGPTSPLNPPTPTVAQPYSRQLSSAPGSPMTSRKTTKLTSYFLNRLLKEKKGRENMDNACLNRAGEQAATTPVAAPPHHPHDMDHDDGFANRLRAAGSRSGLNSICFLFVKNH